MWVPFAITVSTNWVNLAINKIYFKTKCVKINTIVIMFFFNECVLKE